MSRLSVEHTSAIDTASDHAGTHDSDHTGIGPQVKPASDEVHARWRSSLRSTARLMPSSWSRSLGRFRHASENGDATEPPSGPAITSRPSRRRNEQVKRLPS